MQDTSCAVGFRKLVHTAYLGIRTQANDQKSRDDAMVCLESADGRRYSTCCLPNDPASVALEVAVAVMLVTHVWAEVSQQFRITRRVEYENLGQWFKEALSRYTHDIWNILDTAALVTATIAGLTRAFLLDGVGNLSPATTADLHMYAIVFGFLRIMTVLQVFEFSGRQKFDTQTLLFWCSCSFFQTKLYM
jgi:hypothetical protein